MQDSYRIYKEILKFCASSFTGFLVDYILYSLLILLTSGIIPKHSLIISNVGARIVSAGVNFSLNRRFVFKSDTGVVNAAVKYFLLALLILLGNTIVLERLTCYYGINKFSAKIITEILFFFISWSVQHFIIFTKRKEAAEL